MTEYAQADVDIKVLLNDPEPDVVMTFRLPLRFMPELLSQMATRRWRQEMIDMISAGIVGLDLGITHTERNFTTITEEDT